MHVGVPDVNLNPVSATDWHYGLGFLICEKQKTSHSVAITLAKYQLPPHRTPGPRWLNAAGVITCSHDLDHDGSLLHTVTQGPRLWGLHRLGSCTLYNMWHPQLLPRGRERWERHADTQLPPPEGDPHHIGPCASVRTVAWPQTSCRGG